MILHDLGWIPTGVFDGHDVSGVPWVRGLLERNGAFTKEEVDLIVRLTQPHRKKDEAGDPYEEGIKDADVLDIYLSGVAGWKRRMEPRRQRLDKLFKELGFNIIGAKAEAKDGKWH
jgi:hypothetical protein